ncbi:Ima1 N-terminal domain-containing protein [Irpex rosettiformis]|uniref:Ima1 N-terminal domain-containing protein n=1 Tax=Irpex rosettiformis TaxID=378272 RepID=A0ACB8UKJ4_9APHY|nr:Ima1 N-terminal domain-containing protein [Irpex rosettiformis]
MSKLLRRPTRSASCFYCQTLQQPRDPRSFRCSECSCWNRYDWNGEIVSDDPAMYDESLNTRSFARRGLQRKDRLPSMYSHQSQSPFCHECQTNQMLISNLMSNYLPSQDDSDYSRLLAQLPAYQSSLETRYPPICANCLPAVEEEIKRRDNMARTSALGGFLNESRGKGKQRQVTVAQGQKEALERQLVMWKVRGILWAVTIAAFSVAYGTIAFSPSLLRIPSSLKTISPVLALVSITWTAWDPTYASLKRSQLQGRTVRQRGKKEYNTLQFLAWVSRTTITLLIAVFLHKPSWDFLHIHLDSSSDIEPSLRYSMKTQWFFRIMLAFELTVLARSLFVLRIERPPPVRLMQQFSHRPSLSSSTSSRQSTPVIENPPDMFSVLTLSNQPILPGYAANQRLHAGPANAHAHSDTPNPVFGITSLASATQAAEAHELNGGVSSSDLNAMDEDYDPFDDENDHDYHNGDGHVDEKDRDPNAMDWSPIAPANRHSQAQRRSIKMIKGGGQGTVHHYQSQVHQPHRQQRQEQMTRKTGRWDDGSWLRPQRFFVPEEPTGLEGLFEQTISLSDNDRLRGAQVKNVQRGSQWLGWVTGRWK